MRPAPLEILQKGREILNPALIPHGFIFQAGSHGKSGGGDFANGQYVNGSRKLEIHYRSSLGLVTYHFDGISLQHDAYMRAVLGKAGGNRHPGFAEDFVEQFNALRYDLEHFAQAFLRGDQAEFARLAEIAREWSEQSGFAKLP
jgi:hypothetical protein